jgi:anaerobic magnesium-protoporphyrin IX monomethyl ester cyclase
MGLQMLAAVLENSGFRPILLDANAACRRLNIDGVAAELDRLRPAVVGMTLVTPLVKDAYRLAGMLRGRGMKLIAGGPHATLLPEEPLEHGFDAVVVGEGEPTVAEAVAAVLGRIRLDSVLGLAWRDAAGLAHRNSPRPPVADLDSLPRPARHLVPAADFGPPDNPALHADLFTSRGCPARCSYCAGGLFGKRFRFRSADSVVDELIYVYRRYGTRHFHFVDDAMSMDKERMRRICHRLVDERLGVTWNMMTRVDSVDEEILELAARSGCVQIDYGVESGCPETLRRVHKPHSVEMVRRIIPLTRRHGIRPVVFFILGFPWENTPALNETLHLMRELADLVEFHPAIASILIPFPGTEIYEQYSREHGFERWWLGDDRRYDAPCDGVHPFYQRKLYRLGSVLDADFFHYPPEVRSKIHDLFRFMYAQNLRREPWWKRHLILFAMDLSRALDNLAPPLERLLVGGSLHFVERLRAGRQAA